MLRNLPNNFIYIGYPDYPGKRYSKNVTINVKVTKNPFINALAATLYITAVASFMFFGLARSHPDDSVFAPIAFLSLFTLSAAIMGFLFLYQPLLLLLDGHRKKAINLFLQTIAVFAGITFLVLLLLFSGVIH